MITCKSCGRENQDQYKFCLGCGSALPKEAEAPAPAKPEMVSCPHCGAELPTNFKFCGACGGAVSVAPSPAAEPPARPADPARPDVSSRAQAAQPTPAPVVSPEPAPPREVGYLTVIRTDGSEGDKVGLLAGENLIGRGRDESALNDDPFLSPKHATFVVEGSSCVVHDEESLNGVFVRIPSQVELTHGDMIRLGQELLRFEELGKLEAQPEASQGDDTKLAGSPNIDIWARLSLVVGPGLVSRSFALGAEPVQIGREVGDIVFPDDGFVSGTHARVSRVNGVAMLEDLGSSNGTYLRIRGKRTLRHGDLVLMGQQLFRLVLL